MLLNNSVRIKAPNSVNASKRKHKNQINHYNKQRRVLMANSTVCQSKWKPIVEPLRAKPKTYRQAPTHWLKFLEEAVIGSMSLVFRYAQILSHHLFEKELLTRLSYLICSLTSLRAVTSFPCDIICRVWNLIVSVPDPCSFQFLLWYYSGYSFNIIIALVLLFSGILALFRAVICFVHIAFHLPLQPAAV